jgi:hypothetical protein
MTDRPEFDGQPMTRREVLIARHAADEAVKWMFAQMRRVREVAVEHVYGRDYATVTWPLPKLMRPRVVRWPKSAAPAFDYRAKDGTIEWANPGQGDWTPYGSIQEDVQTPGFLRALADLLANPTEEVDADE